MSGIVTVGEVAAASGDAYGAYQGGLSTPSNQASFGAAVAAAASTVASTGRFGAFAQGLGIGVAPAAAVTQAAMNLAALQNAQTPGDALACLSRHIGRRSRYDRWIDATLTTKSCFDCYRHRRLRSTTTRAEPRAAAAVPGRSLEQGRQRIPESVST